MPPHRGLAEQDLELRQNHILSHFTVRGSQVDEEARRKHYFSIFGLVVEAKEAGQHQTWTLRCVPTREVLFEFVSWPKDHFLTAAWRSNLPLDETLEAVSTVVNPLSEMDGEIAAYYDMPVEAAFEQAESKRRASGSVIDAMSSHRTVITTLRKKRRLSVASVVKIGAKVLDRDTFLLPAEISIESEIGDLSIEIAKSQDAPDTNVVCSIGTARGLDSLLVPMLKETHTWKFVDVVHLF